VTEIVPGDHVTVIVGAETLRVPWAEVDRVIVSSSPAPAPSASPKPAPDGPHVRVHITTPKQVILYRRAPGSTSWSRVCTSPCDAEVPLGGSYRITGNGVPATAPFSIEANPGSVVDLAVDPASTGGMIGGGFLAATGGTIGFVGLVLAAVGEAGAPRHDRGASGMSRDAAEDVRNAGLVTLAVGGLLTLGGILIFVSSGKTDVTQASSSADHAAAGRPLDAFLRAPSWRRQATAEAAAPSTFPILLQGSF
jgi:hypothetical protein